MNALLVYPVVYVLECEGDEHHARTYYVGNSLNLNHRLSQHWQGAGSLWTRLHKPVKVLRIEIVTEGDANIVENMVTLELMHEHGREVVRGGKWTKP